MFVSDYSAMEFCKAIFDAASKEMPINQIAREYGLNKKTAITAMRKEKGTNARSLLTAMVALGFDKSAKVLEQTKKELIAKGRGTNAEYLEDWLPQQQKLRIKRGLKEKTFCGTPSYVIKRQKKAKALKETVDK